MQAKAGFFRGIVESVNDPNKLGRVQIRVPSLHGIQGRVDSIPTKSLPWAIPGTLFNSGQQRGSFMIPDTGTIVIVAFEQEDISRPIYFGSIFASPRLQQFNIENPLDYMGHYIEESEVPQANELNPKTRIIYKSPKGAEISIEERDNLEAITILDRVGQRISLVSNVPSDVNKNNKGKLGSQELEDYLDNAIELPHIVLDSKRTNGSGVSLRIDSKSATISLTDENGNTITKDLLEGAI